MPHPDKERIIHLVNNLLHRSGLTITQVVARMQARGCDVTRTTFENRFTTRADKLLDIPPEWTLALVAALTERLTSQERCTAAEAIELARLSRLPLEKFDVLKSYFSETESAAAFKQHAPALASLPAGADLLPADQTAICPYRGLQVFDEEHAEFFCGREAGIERLQAILQRSRFLAVIGPSGSGKSSLVRAGLIPLLRQERQRRLRLLQPGRSPLTALAQALTAPSKDSPAGLINDFKADDRRLHRLVPDRWSEMELALIVDQFEEVFTLAEDEVERGAFVANLVQAALQPHSRTVVILTLLRADFYGHVAAYPELARLRADHQALIGPLSGAALRRVITQPAKKVGLHFEPGLVDRLLQDAAGEPGALPLLEHALLELWERRAGTPAAAGCPEPDCGFDSGPHRPGCSGRPGPLCL